MSVHMTLELGKTLQHQSSGITNRQQRKRKWAYKNMAANFRPIGGQIWDFREAYVTFRKLPTVSPHQTKHTHMSPSFYGTEKLESDCSSQYFRHQQTAPPQNFNPFCISFSLKDANDFRPGSGEFSVKFVHQNNEVFSATACPNHCQWQIGNGVFGRQYGDRHRWVVGGEVIMWFV